MILLDSHLKAFLIKLRNSLSRVLLNTPLANKLFFPVCFWNIRLKHRNQFKLQTDHVKPLSGPKRLIQRRQWEPTPVLLPGKSHGQRSLVGCSPRGLEELDTTEQLHFHYSLSCIGEGNDNPLQCSCLENPRDGGAWWAAVYGVTQSWTRLNRLSSSSIRRRRKVITGLVHQANKLLHGLQIRKVAFWILPFGHYSFKL